MSQSPLNILLLGSGGRESALAWKMSQSPLCKNLYIAPGNGGTGRYGTNVAIRPTDFAAIDDFVKANGIELIVVGNEDPLVAGIQDYFEGSGVLVLGPSKEGAQLEGSKDFAKQFMCRHNIPTARYRSFTSETVDDGCKFLTELEAPYVLKADGLAAGKGVLIIDDLEEAQQSLREMLGGMFGKSSSTVVIEEFLSGIECSVFVLTDGNGGYRILPEAKDYKDKVEDRIIKPTVNGLAAEGITYRGFIFLGLINVGGEPMVIEYNVRMGDPETEVVMPRIASDLVPAALAAAKGCLGDTPLETDSRAATTVMMVSGGYPGDYAKGMAITGLDKNPADGVYFHAGTKLTDDGKTVTDGGRVAAATCLAPTVEEALAKSYAAVEAVDFDGKYFRRDIGRDLMAMA